jgi:hypothetical protein
MTERLAVSTGGETIAYCDDRALHSRYDPKGEAQKYINTLKLKGSYFVLIESGLGYLIPVLRERFPEVKLVILHCSGFLAKQQAVLFPPENGAHGKQTAVWCPERGNLKTFLEQEIPDIPAAEISIIEWRPALAAYGERYLFLVREVLEFIKLADANYRTASNFGKKWFKNFFRNIGLIKYVAERPAVSGRPWIITGAGPSLEESARMIRELVSGRGDFREKGAFVLASSSSVPALRRFAIEPDIVISTDGGNWALLHIYEVMRQTGILSAAPVKKPVLAASLCAALPSQAANFPILPLSDGSLWQELILESLGIPHLSFPQRGTVTASALDLALTLTDAEIMLAGMDLSRKDIKTHAAPYSFDRLREEKANRLNPAYSQAFARAGNIASSGSQKVYAEWFRNQLAGYPDRVLSLGGNNPVFAELNTKHRRSNTVTGYRKETFAVRKIELPPNPAKTGVELLLKALETAETGEPLRRELSPLLLPENSIITLIDEIRALVKGCADG